MAILRLADIPVAIIAYTGLINMYYSTGTLA